MKIPPLLLVPCLALTSASLGQWQNGAKTRLLQFITPAMVVKMPRRLPGRVRRSPRTMRIPRPFSPPVKVNDTPVDFSRPPTFKGGITQVGLRDFVRSIQPWLKERIEIQWVDREVRIFVRLPSGSPSPSKPDDRFGQAWLSLFNGSPREARELFASVAGEVGPYSDVSKQLQTWIDREKYDAVVRFEWWQMPPDVTVVFDDEPVLVGVPFALTRSGRHTLAFYRDDKPFFSGPIDIRPNSAYGVRIESAG